MVSGVHGREYSFKRTAHDKITGRFELRCQIILFFVCFTEISAQSQLNTGCEK
jgi:hypothetical protein